MPVPVVQSTVRPSGNTELQSSLFAPKTLLDQSTAGRLLLRSGGQDYGVQVPVVHGVPPSLDDDVRQSSETTEGEPPVQVMVTVLAVWLITYVATVVPEGSFTISAIELGFAADTGISTE